MSDEEFCQMDIVHGALGFAYAHGMTLSDVLAVLSESGIDTAEDFDTAIEVAVKLKLLKKRGQSNG